MVYNLSFRTHTLLNASLKYSTDNMKIGNKTQNSVTKISVRNLSSQVTFVTPETLSTPFLRYKKNSAF